MSLAVITSAIGTYILLGIDKDPNHPDDTHHQRVLRTLGISTTNKASLTIRPDESKKFLPDPLPEPYGRPYTLFIELNDSLVHPVFDKSVGWKVAIRPGAKDLLAYLSRFYEVVIWTDSLNYVGDPIIQALDPYRFACYRLYRDATTSIGTEYVKDLSVTNRDPKKCIIVDINPSAYQLQPENGMPLQKWNGEKGDDELRKLSAFLDELAFLGMMLQIEDLRPLLKQIRAAGPSNIGDAWSAHKEWMRGEFDKLLPPPPASGISGVTAALFGRSFTPQTTPNVISQIEMLAKQERQAFEKDKVEMEKQLADAMKEQEKQMNEHMEKLKDGNYKFFDYLSGSVPMPGQPQQGN
ncbi:HAD-like domain-containing protein [Polychytrium aggregatum]|uniref:HAD-like domain-containing protein n=1 Tax=Polychytrium aggregatum TaxID=110093 RepID=UPI0022FDC347|nr:HAD-like domain-containing protein [Polychytrium aggregatum]KAI9205681.1 HAD-like domain-containing protein [Polychytrium aggregatum]